MIYTAKYVLPITSDPIQDGGVLVQEDRITAVGQNLRQSYPDERSHDLGEAILLPGLINTHSHLDYTILRGAIDDLPLFPWVRKLTEYAIDMPPEAFRWSSLLGAAELIRSGVTATADATFSGASMDALLESGMRGVVCQEVFGYRTDDFAVELEMLQDRASALASKASSRVRVGVSPHSIYTVSPGLLQAVRDYAYAESLPLVIHVAESLAEHEFCVRNKGDIARLYRTLGLEWECPGVSPVQYLYDLGMLGHRTLAAHCVHVNEDDVRLLAVTRTGVAHCPRSNSKLCVGTAPVGIMLQAGVRMGLGTDSAVSNNTLDILGEIRASIVVQRAQHRTGDMIEAKRMVEAATVGGADALGMEAEIGSIEPGKKADLTAIDISGPHCFPDRDPYSLLAYCASAGDVAMTIVDGVELYKRPDLRTLNLEEIKSNVTRALAGPPKGDL